jgi:hypothetical protein
MKLPLRSLALISVALFCSCSKPPLCCREGELIYESVTGLRGPEATEVITTQAEVRDSLHVGEVIDINSACLRVVGLIDLHHLAISRSNVQVCDNYPAVGDVCWRGLGEHYGFNYICDHSRWEQIVEETSGCSLTAKDLARIKAGDKKLAAWWSHCN